MRLITDECLSPKIALRLRDVGLAATSVRDEGIAGFTDAEVLTYSHSQSLVVLTPNRKDFRRLHWQEIPHAGIIRITAPTSPELETFIENLAAAVKQAEVDLFGRLYCIDWRARGPLVEL